MLTTNGDNYLESVLKMSDCDQSRVLEKMLSERYCSSISVSRLEIIYQACHESFLITFTDRCSSNPFIREQHEHLIGSFLCTYGVHFSDHPLHPKKLVGVLKKEHVQKIFTELFANTQAIQNTRC